MQQPIEKLAIASDHAGFELKESLKEYLIQSGRVINDLGPENGDSVDYPDYGVRLAQAIATREADRGVVMCGTGVGMSIVVNRFPEIRGTLCSDVYTARLCREHNDSNVLIMGARVVGMGLAQAILSTWLNTPFEGGRHQRRLDKIKDINAILSKGEL